MSTFLINTGILVLIVTHFIPLSPIHRWRKLNGIVNVRNPPKIAKQTLGKISIFNINKELAA